MRWILATALTLTPSLAAAHIALVSPAPRTSSQKAGPCGAAGSVRGANVTTLAPGATITVSWKETIDHPGHFRISFDNDGQDFVVPPNATATTEGMENVMVDLIADVQGGGLPAGGRPYTQDITLPDIECENCTLQIIQLMTDKPPYTLPTDAGGSNDIYYQCADIRLAAGTPPPDPNPDPDPVPDPDPADPDPTGDDGGGCSTGGGAGLAFGALALVGLRRRRRA